MLNNFLSIRAQSVTILIILIFIALSSTVIYALQVTAPPNILVFLMDDMGIGDSRVYNKNSKVSMPNLEKLAEAGMTFSDAHAPAAVCAPTRYSVMTGNYPMAWEKSERYLVI